MVNYYRGMHHGHITLSEAKIKLSWLVDKVNTTDEEIVITKNGRPAAVLVSPGEFEG